VRVEAVCVVFVAVVGSQVESMPTERGDKLISMYHGPSNLRVDLRFLRRLFC
jgi:hypothetical protein